MIYNIVSMQYPDVAAMDAAVESDEAESDAKAEATGPVADKPG